MSLEPIPFELLKRKGGKEMYSIEKPTTVWLDKALVRQLRYLKLGKTMNETIWKLFSFHQHYHYNQELRRKQAGVVVCTQGCVDI